MAESDMDVPSCDGSTTSSGNERVAGKDVKVTKRRQFELRQLAVLNSYWQLG